MLSVCGTFYNACIYVCDVLQQLITLCGEYLKGTRQNRNMGATIAQLFLKVHATGLSSLFVSLVSQWNMHE